MSCWDTIQAYAGRSIGYGERLLPREGFSICEQFTLIGSGLLWNIYFGALALFLGFFLANAVAMAKISRHIALRKPAEWFIFLFRGSPLFIQFFLAYLLILALKNADGGGLISLLKYLFPDGFVDGYLAGPISYLVTGPIRTIVTPFSAAAMGALVVLILNTTAYSAEIFYGALQSVPKGDIEAADAYGMSGWSRFRRIIWPTAMRLAWPSYTNEAIFLFHATTLVFFSGFPVWQQRGDALYYAKYFADKTFNPFIPYPIVGFYFILLTLGVIALFGWSNRRLNRHLPAISRTRLKIRPQIIR